MTADMSHTAVSWMLNAGVPLRKIGMIAGWSGSTLVLVAKRYDHFSLNELPGAVESISGTGIETGPRYLMEVRSQSIDSMGLQSIAACVY